MNNESNERTDGQTNVSMDRWIDGSMDRRKNGRTVGWMDGWIESGNWILIIRFTYHLKLRPLY